MEQYQDVIHLRGSLRAILCDAKDGAIIREIIQDNVVVTAGRAWVLGQLQTVNQLTAQVISHLAIGSSTVAPVTGDTALGGEVTRLAISSFLTTGLTANPPSWQAQASFATNLANTTLAEMGLFNSSGGGTMLGHATFASFVKATSNTFSVSYTISG